MDDDDYKTPCPECCGKGWNEFWREVDGRFDKGEWFKETCNACEGEGVQND